MYASKMAPARPARPNNNQLLTRFKAKNLHLTRLKSLRFQTEECQISSQILIHCSTHHSCRMTASKLTWSQSKWTSAEPSLESDDTPGDALLRHRHPDPPIGRNKTSQDWSDFSCLGLLVRLLLASRCGLRVNFSI